MFYKRGARAIDDYYFRGLSVQLPTYVLLPKYPTFERASEVSEYSSEYLGLLSAEEGSCSVSLRLKVRGGRQSGKARRSALVLQPLQILCKHSGSGTFAWYGD